MNDVVEFLQENPVVFVATAGLDGKPKVRPFQFMLEKDNRLWFCTGSQKGVYRELQVNPYVEISASSPQAVWTRISGKVVFADDQEVKKTILEQNGLVRSIYETPDNPVFKTFYLTEATAGIFDFSGNPPKRYTL